MKILQINSSARVEGANSTRLANTVTARLQAKHPGATVTVRDLAVTPHPVLDAAALGALFTPADQRTPEQAARVALDDALIAEVQAHDAIVLGVPMYNFGVPVQLKTCHRPCRRDLPLHRQRSGRPHPGQEGVRGLRPWRHLP